MSITEALRGMDTVTCETPEEVSHMMVTGESQLEARGRKVRLESINHAKVSLTWSPEGRRRRGRPKTTWRRTVESEWRRLGFNSWTQIEQVAKDRAKWKELTYNP